MAPRKLVKRTGLVRPKPPETTMWSIHRERTISHKCRKRCLTAGKVCTPNDNDIPKLPHRFSVHDHLQTRYVTGVSIQLSAVRRQQLEAGDGEILITNIPTTVKAERIADIAANLSELYKLQFALTPKGVSSGTAVLQYLQSDLTKHSPRQLRELFRHFNLPMLHFQSSGKPIKIQLTNVTMPPPIVNDLLDTYINYVQMEQLPLYNGHPVYVIAFDSSENARKAFEILSKLLFQLGSHCAIQWVTKHRNWPKLRRCKKTRQLEKRAGMTTNLRSKSETKQDKKNLKILPIIGATNQPHQKDTENTLKQQDNFDSCSALDRFFSYQDEPKDRKRVNDLTNLLKMVDEIFDRDSQNRQQQEEPEEEPPMYELPMQEPPAPLLRQPSARLEPPGWHLPMRPSSLSRLARFPLSLQPSPLVPVWQRPLLQSPPRPRQQPPELRRWLNDVSPQQRNRRQYLLGPWLEEQALLRHQHPLQQQHSPPPPEQERGLATSQFRQYRMWQSGPQQQRIFRPRAPLLGQMQGPQENEQQRAPMGRGQLRPYLDWPMLNRVRRHPSMPSLNELDESNLGRNIRNEHAGGSIMRQANNNYMSNRLRYPRNNRYARRHDDANNANHDDNSDDDDLFARSYYNNLPDVVANNAENLRRTAEMNALPLYIEDLLDPIDY